MTGKIIIEAVPLPEELQRANPGASGLSIRTDMKKVRRDDKAGIVQGVMEALEFDPGDYGVLAMLLMDRKGEHHTEYSVRVPLEEDLQ